MFSTAIVTLLLAAGASATPIYSMPQAVDLPEKRDGISSLFTNLPSKVSTAVPSYNSTVWDGSSALGENQVLLFGLDRSEVVDLDEYLDKIQPYLNYTEEHAHVYNNTIQQGHVIDTRDEFWDHEKRCPSITTTVVDKTETFVDWDVQMSPVVHAAGELTTISVASGYTVANAVTVGAGGDFTWIKDVLKTSLKVDYTKTWTTSYTTTISARVDVGYSGTIVTKPQVNRKFGRVLQGCIGAQKEVGSFQATSHEEGSYANVKWVQGTVTLCQKKVEATSRLSRCNGGGDFV